jgi:hypothetical protein
MLKKITLSLCAVVALGSVAFAGTETYSGKETKNTVQQQTCPEWYATNEWNVNLWGTYAFTGTEWRDDRYLGVDHAWGGGLDAKYFFARYFGLGVEAYGLALNNQRGFTLNIGNGYYDRIGNSGDRGAAGAALGTFTFRYPIPCTRFAPYAFVGGGGIFGGGGREDVFVNGNGVEVAPRRGGGTDSKLIGQFGGGFEVRMTPHIGWTNDFSWNVVDGTQNNFGMVRSGINFAF